MIPHTCSPATWCDLCDHNERAGGRRNHPSAPRSPKAETVTPTARQSLPVRGPCEYLGKRTEFRPGCGGRMCKHECEAGEPFAVPGGVCLTCPKWVPQYDPKGEHTKPAGVTVDIGPPPALTPTSDRIVCTVAVGETGAAMLAATGPLMERYARRIGADFHAITGDPLNPGYPLADKFRLHHLTPHYRRLLFLDADCLIRPDAPDVFAEVDESAVGMHDDLPLVPSAVPLEAATRSVAASQGVSYPGLPHVLNTGVVVWSAAHPRLWEPPARPLPAGVHVAEQCMVQLRVGECGYPLAPLARGWNHQWWADRRLSALGTDTHVLHLAGLSQMDEVNGWKLDAGAVRAVVLRAAGWAGMTLGDPT